MWNVQNGQYHYTYIKVHIGRMTIKIKMRCVYVLHAEKSVYDEYILNLFNVGFFFSRMVERTMSAPTPHPVVCARSPTLTKRETFSLRKLFRVFLWDVLAPDSCFKRIV